MMNKTHSLLMTALVGAAIGVVLGAVSAPTLAQAPIVQPGAPGEATRSLSADEAIRLAGTRFSPADVRFMTDMIPHHHQATQMAALVADRTNWEPLIEIAGRIDASQADEIEFMQGWLADRGQPVPDPSAHHHMHMNHEMAGMATPEQMAELADSEGVDFDRLFLELMIAHHQGAITMVDELLEQPGSAYDPTLFEFTSDVVNDQTAEIERMNELLSQISSDPRATLAAGIDDAESAIDNLRLVASLPRPPGFFDPNNPGDLPLKRLAELNAGDDEATEAEDASEDAAEDGSGGDERPRWPLLSFSNTDMAFSGDVLVAGSYHGFNIYRLADDGAPSLISSVVCPGGQGDVSIVGDLLIMSVEQNSARLDCGLQGVEGDVSPERFRGLRIFDISDLAAPQQVGAVQTCRGSHTHSVVSADEDRIVVYNSGTAPIRATEELPICIDDLPGDERTALFRIDVIEIPVDDPAAARIVDSPAVFADEESGALAGLWRGGDHGEGTQETNDTDHCHDITVFPSLNLAAGACSGNGILFDISDPMDPKRLDAVVDPGFAYWHSATFNNDGTKVLFTDEWGGGMRPRCRPSDPKTWGANAIYDIVDGQLEFQGYYKLPAPQSETENCVAHNGSIIPVPGRDLFAQAWYQGGLSVMDFSDSEEAIEIAYFDRGPLDEEELVLAGYWSTYFYRGRIYGTEIVRGLDVFALEPSEHLSANEIAAAELAIDGGLFNPQQQFPISWPDVPVVARAYIDQLMRAMAIDEAMVLRLEEALTQADAALAESRGDRETSAALIGLADALRASDAPVASEAERKQKLVNVLEGIAANLQ
ncbi:DUF305 domain-containing protein [Wenzhouxiangella marina]|uniref:Secreted protein n=1 Tax=Wenzhouxiangella marina TaxID=1579979 RepID=A0A0K0XZY5_9GAMM|nr:DUF305 domain-containing protein [Wenzhouxiangella marina]AKS43197.1 Secreted protein [Wenzhouxiangella marina]MBB6087117.1 uncharacterized protein (DUF305 family) [Wenzhouxiangella marina]